jgi:glutathione peroxidase
MASVHDFTVRTIDGKELPLSGFKGKALLIVNTASACGLTPQYDGLETLQKRYAEQGFSVLGFPCNQFGAQEPGTEEEIASFCSTNYGVSFPLFQKIDVNGAAAHPLYRFLKASAPGGAGDEPIEWNFAKFLVDGGGAVVKRFSPRTEPAALAADIEALIARQSAAR